MATKNTIVVPCMVKSWLKPGAKRSDCSERQVDAHQGRFDTPDDQKDESVRDVHQSDLLVIDRRQPLVYHAQRRAALLGASVPSIPSTA
jgi:hypothetical protein